jgi:hypothetical protein
MNCTFKNFKKFSVKQIKTYAAVIMMSTLSLEATAFAAEEVANPVIEMVAAYETSFVEEEILLESWMLNPFEVSVDEGTSNEMLLPASSELLFEPELALESWMAVPFEISVSEEAPVENSFCSPAP